MSIAVGFAFTEFPIQNLKKRGFDIQQTNQTTDEGFYQFRCFIPNFSTDLVGFEIREVLDEDRYHPSETSKMNSKKFEPFITSCEKQPGVPHQNTAQRILGALHKQDQMNPDLYNFLNLRKNFNLWALWIECGDLEKFKEIAKPDFEFVWQNKQAQLLHLGPNCFDLIVTQA